MRAHGRPVLAAFAGVGFGLGLGLTLLVFGAVALDSVLLIVFPVAFLALGIVWALAAPLGGRKAARPAP